MARPKSPVAAVPPIERALASLYATAVPAGTAPSLPVLAMRLLALDVEPSSAIARRLVGAALGADPAALPDPFEGPRAAAMLAPPAEPAEAPGWLRAVALESADLLVVDLETTGSAASGSTILEIGAVRVANGCVADRFQTLVNPLGPIPFAIQALTGIGDRMVAGAPTLEPALRAFTAWMARAPHAPFVAHNAPFDEGFVRRGLALCGLPPLDRAVLCTRRLARRLVPELARHGLDALCERFAIGNRARHRALGDAEATAELLLLLVRRARERAGLATLGQLLDFHRSSVRGAQRALASIAARADAGAQAAARAADRDPQDA